MNKEEINIIKEKIKNFSGDLKALSLTAVYFKLTNKTENLQEKYNYLFNEFKDIKLGCFVSFYINNKLRGCIGTIEPTFENIIIEIINNSISSAFKDPRFDPISLMEYPFLTNKIDFIINIEKINSLDSLNSKEYGIIVKKGNKRGVLLPDIESIDTVEKQLEIAFNKASLKYNKENLFKEVLIYRFQVIRI